MAAEALSMDLLSAQEVESRRWSCLVQQFMTIPTSTGRSIFGSSYRVYEILVTCAYLVLSLSSDFVEPSYSSESAATLETESGYVMETSRVAEFRRCILEGTWREAEQALEHLGVAEDDGLWVWFYCAQLNESCVLIHRVC